MLYILTFLWQLREYKVRQSSLYLSRLFVFLVSGLLFITCSSDGKSSTGPDDQGDRITVAGGGVITSPDGLLTLTIPPGALKEDTNISVDVVLEADSVNQLTNIDVTGSVYRFNPDGLVFNYPIELNIDMPNDEVNEIITEDGYPSIGGVLYSLGGILDFTDSSKVDYDLSTGTAQFSDYIDHFSFYAKTVPIWIEKWENDIYSPELVGEIYVDADFGPAESDIGPEHRVIYSLKNTRGEFTYYCAVRTYWSQPDNVPLIWERPPGFGDIYHVVAPHTYIQDVEHPYKWVCKENGDGWIGLQFWVGSDDWDLPQGISSPFET